MESNTDRIQRVLLLWLELNHVVSQAESTEPHPRRRCLPWSSDDAQVRNVWRQLTDPVNLLALEQWLCQSAEGQSAEWSRQALRSCRERIRREDSDELPQVGK